MTHEVTETEQPQRLSVTVDMATRYGMNPVAFERVVRSVCMPVKHGDPEPTREEFAAFLLVAKEHRLNPITREIYAMKRKGGGLVPVVGVDGSKASTMATSSCPPPAASTARIAGNRSP